VVQCIEEPGALSQVARLDQAAQHQREAIAMVTGLDEREIEVEVLSEIPPEVRELLDRGTKDRETAAYFEQRAAKGFRHAALLLAEGGYSLRDIGRLLNVSHQRAHQLVGEAQADHGSRRRRRPRQAS
jgi:hypothetical protein